MYKIYISRPTLYGYFYVWLIDNIRGKIVLVEGGVVIYGAFATPCCNVYIINKCSCVIFFLLFLVCVWYGSVH